MKAIGLYRYLPIEDPESLIDREIETPVPGAHQLLVRVKAIAVNPVDVKTRGRKAQAESTPRILGWDVAGIVEAVGPDCALFRPGDAVYYAGDWLHPGAYSELHLVDERIVGRKPDRLNFAEAAALPLTTITAWEGLFDRLLIAQQADKNRGKSILIINAAGGVGSIATQLAYWAGLTVIGTASRPASMQWAREHGADYIIDHRQSLALQLQQSGYPTIDSILCLKNVAQHWDKMVEVITPQGKICLIDDVSSPPDTSLLHAKSLTLAFENIFTRPNYQTADVLTHHYILSKVAELVDAGVIQSTLTERLSPITASTLRQAHAKVETGKMIGKLVLEQFPD
ncbi:MAG: zinc-binding alcohol dehydrogenase family protein [Ktedonobacteraceae bacterium]|nr:zinc-binding alcohol dehydrogenase family protein [Ktedonobacteraceae bacterium]